MSQVPEAVPRVGVPPTEARPPDASAISRREAPSITYEVGDRIPLPGQGECMVLREISRGTGEADVFAVFHGDTERALKVYYPFDDPRLEPREEALALVQSIDSPHVLKLHDFGVGDRRLPGGRCWELLQYASGGTLEALCDDGPRPSEAELTELVRQCAIGLRALHACGVYLNDLKPSNVLFLDARRDRVVLGDFGAARTRPELTLDHTTVAKCTEFYAPPELRLSFLSPTGDSFALGMTLLQLGWLGTRARCDAEYRSILLRLARKEPIAPRSDAPVGRLEQLLNGLTVFDHEARWGDQELERWLAEEWVPVRYGSSVEAIKLQVTGGGTREVSKMPELIDALGDRGAVGAVVMLSDTALEDTRDVVKGLRGREFMEQFRSWCGELTAVEKDRSSDFLRVGMRHYLLPELPIPAPPGLIRWSTRAGDLRAWWKEVVQWLAEYTRAVPRADLARGENPVALRASLTLLAVQAALRGVTDGPDPRLREEARSLAAEIQGLLPGARLWHLAWRSAHPHAITVGWLFRADPGRGVRIQGDECRTAEEVLAALSRAPDSLKHEQTLLHLKAWAETEALRRGDERARSDAPRVATTLDAHALLWRLGARCLWIDGKSVSSRAEVIALSDAQIDRVLADQSLVAWFERALGGSGDDLKRLRTHLPRLPAPVRPRAVRWLLGDDALALNGEAVRSVSELIGAADKDLGGFDALLTSDVLPAWFEFARVHHDVPRPSARSLQAQAEPRAAFDRSGLVSAVERVFARCRDEHLSGQLRALIKTLNSASFEDMTEEWRASWRAERVLRWLGAEAPRVEVTREVSVGAVAASCRKKAELVITATGKRGVAHGAVEIRGVFKEDGETVRCEYPGVNDAPLAAWAHLTGSNGRAPEQTERRRGFALRVGERLSIPVEVCAPRAPQPFGEPSLALRWSLAGYDRYPWSDSPQDVRVAASLDRDWADGLEVAGWCALWTLAVLVGVAGAVAATVVFGILMLLRGLFELLTEERSR